MSPPPHPSATPSANSPSATSPSATGRTEDGTPPATGWLAPILGPLRPLFAEAAVASVFINLLALAAPIFVLQVYDRVVYHGGLTTLQGLAIGMVVAIAFDFVLRQARAKVMRVIALHVDVHAGRKLFDKFVSLPLSTLEGRPAAHWQQVFRDLDTVRNTLAGGATTLVFDVPLALVFMVVVFIIAQPVGWVLFLAAAAFLVLAWASARAVARAVERERQRGRDRDALMAETIMGRTTIKALALEERLRPVWETTQADLIEQSIGRGARSDTFVNLGAMLTVATSVAMTVVGALAILDQEMTIGGLVAANMMSGRLLAPLNQLVGAWRTWAAFREAGQRLGGLFALASDRMEAVVDHPPPRGVFTLENATYRYRPDGRPALDGLSLTLRPGGLTCVVGANGSGKSTFLKLLMGLYAPAPGRVLLDGADIAQFSRRQMARWIGYVPQECVLFDGTVRDAIAQGHPEAADADILDAARLSGAHEVIADLPDGYASRIGEMGHVLSGGMRQRLAIARALVGKPPILLLDEPTASLDRAAEDALRHTLVALAAERTVVVVTHAPAFLGACAHLLVLDHGRVSAYGPRDEVMRAASRREPPAASPAPAARGAAPVSLRED